MEKERFLAFTDAIIAIIATIMVLEIPLPKLDSTMEFSAEELEEAWPRFKGSIYI